MDSPMRLRRLLIVPLLAALAAGCVHQSRIVTTASVAEPPPVVEAEPAGPVAPPPYRLGSGDRLRVVVFGQEGLTNTYSVDANGAITMPLIGSVPARGLTTAELSGAISTRLRKGFIREPHVAVEIEAYRPFFILGEVTNPGQYAYVANMTVETAVAIAGGFTPRAYRKTVTLTRGYEGMLTRGKVPVIFPVEPGDTINVAERWF
jgi:polysaccharide biosynthesis/export protein